MHHGALLQQVVKGSYMRTQKAPPSRGILAVMASCMALQMTGYAVFIPLFALRFDSFGAGVRALGTSDMAFALTYACAAPVTGMLADRFGRRPLILFSVAGHVLTFAGYLVSTAAWQLILLRGLAGIFAAGSLPVVTSIVGDLAPEDRRGRWIGIVQGGAAIGYIAGPLLGGVLNDRFGFAAPSAVAIAMAVAALLLALLKIPETYTPPVAAGPAHSAWAHVWADVPVRSTVLMVLLITFGVMFTFAFVQPQLMFYAYDDLGWTSTRLGFVMSAYAVAFMVCAFALGQLSDRLGRKPVLVLGLVLYSAQFLGLLVFRDAAWIMVSFIIAGLGNALYEPTTGAIVLDITPPEHTAGMLGVRNTAGSIGSMLGPGLVVLLAPILGARAGFLIVTLLMALLVLAAALALRLPQRAGLAGRSQPIAVDPLGIERQG